MRLSGCSTRAGAWLVWLALLLGPIGPGGAWHVANADVLGTTGAASHVLDPAAQVRHVKHAGPSCLVCQSLQGARAVLLAGVALALSPPQAAPALPVVSCPLGSHDSRPSASRAPPLA